MVDQRPAKFTTYDTSDDGYSGIFEVPDGSFYHHEEVDRAIAQRDRRIAELEARIRKASDMLEDDGRFGDRAHDARRAVWNTLVGEVIDG